MALVIKIIQVSRAQFHNTSPVHCIMYSPPLEYIMYYIYILIIPTIIKTQNKYILNINGVDYKRKGYDENWGLLK